MILNLLIYFSFLLFSLGQLGRISFINQQINVYLYEVFVGLLVVMLLFKFRSKPLAHCIKNFKSIILFFGVLLFSFVINITNYNLRENLVAFLYFFRLIMYFIFFVYLSFYINKEKKQSLITKGIAIFMVITIVFSLIQYFLYPDLRNLFYLGWDPHLYRMFGLFFDTSVSGAIYGIVFLYLLIGKPNIHKFARYFLITIYFIFIILTFSRSLYLALTISIVVMFFKKRSFKSIILYSLFFILFLTLVPKPSGEGVNLLRMFSIESRKLSYIQAIKIWEKKPVFGIGYNHIRYEKIKENVLEYDLKTSHAGASFHSSFLIILVCGGVIGLVLFLSVLYRLAVINELSLILIIFLSLLSLSDNILLHPFILFLFPNSLFDN